jgi:hypothetical protein
MTGIAATWPGCQGAIEHHDEARITLQRKPSARVLGALSLPLQRLKKQYFKYSP